MTPLAGARIVLGVTGSVAAYKAAEVASRLTQAGALVDTVVTAGAPQFVRPLLFTALTRRPAHEGSAEGWTDVAAGHVSLASEADLLLVAPASANAIARLALGLADDLLGMVALSTRAPLLVAPAMEHGMFHHSATQAHLATLRQRGATVVGPETGRLASGAEGDGRLASAEAIVGHARLVLGRDGALAGRRVVVTAGGTREPIDPVRYLGNRSSGRMGFALAQAALDRGAAVDLIAGPTSLAAPVGAAVVRVESAEQMGRAVTAACAAADALLMSAAVADYRPAAVAAAKIKKEAVLTEWSLPLVKNDDILAGIRRDGLIKIGFAAETSDLERHAREKLARKGLALIVGNDAVATIGSDESTAVLLQPGTEPERLPAMSKAALAGVIIDRLVTLIAARGGGG
jgi:phosphopantothenoylcysteine decarboxylase/phosphopantothenate--cysteine ligase